MLKHLLSKSDALKKTKKGVIHVRQGQKVALPKLQKTFSNEQEELEWEMLKQQVTLQRTITEDERMKAKSVVEVDGFDNAKEDQTNIGEDTMKKVLDIERLSHMMQLAKARATEIMEARKKQPVPLPKVPQTVVFDLGDSKDEDVDMTDDKDPFKTPSKRELKQARFVASVNADSESNKMPVEQVRRNRENRK